MRRLFMNGKTRTRWWRGNGVFRLVLVVVLLAFSQAPSSSSDTASSSVSSPTALELLEQNNVTDPVGLYELQEVAAKIGPSLPPVDFHQGRWKSRMV